MRALARRGRIVEGAHLIVGELVIDRSSHKVSRHGDTVDLTTREFELLDYLMQHVGQVVSREALARDVWKESARSTSLGMSSTYSIASWD